MNSETVDEFIKTIDELCEQPEPIDKGQFRYLARTWVDQLQAALADGQSCVKRSEKIADNCNEIVERCKAIESGYLGNMKSVKEDIDHLLGHLEASEISKDQTETFLRRISDQLDQLTQE